MDGWLLLQARRRLSSCTRRAQHSWSFSTHTPLGGLSPPPPFRLPPSDSPSPVAHPHPPFFVCLARTRASCGVAPSTRHRVTPLSCAAAGAPPRPSFPPRPRERPAGLRARRSSRCARARALPSGKRAALYRARPPQSSDGAVPVVAADQRAGRARQRREHREHGGHHPEHPTTRESGRRSSLRGRSSAGGRVGRSASTAEGGSSSSSAECGLARARARPLCRRCSLSLSMAPRALVGLPGTAARRLGATDESARDERPAASGARAARVRGASPRARASALSARQPRGRPCAGLAAAGVDERCRDMAARVALVLPSPSRSSHTDNRAAPLPPPRPSPGKPPTHNRSTTGRSTCSTWTGARAAGRCTP
jgi:hypothetical protein